MHITIIRAKERNPSTTLPKGISIIKILMFGRGVISTQYGWALEKAGHTVEFYVRPGRIAQYGNFVNLNIVDGRVGLKGTTITNKWFITMTNYFYLCFSFIRYKT